MISAARKLQNDIVQIENASAKKVPSDYYYIIKFSLLELSDPKQSFEKLKGVAKALAVRNFDNDNKPLAVYFFQKDFYILFSALSDSKEHYLKGNHHDLCSHFVSKFARDFSGNVSCSIIEMESRTKVLIYFQTKINENSRKLISDLFKNNPKKYLDLSQKEIEDNLLKLTPPVIWDKIPIGERYGMFFKTANSKISIFSEGVSVTNLERLSGYLFGII